MHFRCILLLSVEELSNFKLIPFPSSSKIFDAPKSISSDCFLAPRTAAWYIDNMNRRTYFLLFALLTGALLTGCIEHTFYITVMPDESVRIAYEMRGDRVDFEDGHELMPDSLTWNMKREVVEEEDRTVHVAHGSVVVKGFDHLNQAFQWGRTSKDTVNLKQTAELTERSVIFGTAYKFNLTLHSRRFNDLYGNIWDFVPEECRALQDRDLYDEMSSEEVSLLENKFALGIIQWNHERYLRRLARVWEIVKSRVPDLPDTSSTTFSIAKGGWNDDLRGYLNQLDIPSPSLVYLNWWDDLRPQFLGHLVDIAGVDSTNLIIRVSEAVEDEYRTTMDLKDDAFRFVLSMPGKITDTNGKRVEEGVEWNFSGSDILNQDRELYALSFEPSLWRIGIFIVLVLFVLRRFKNIVKRRKGI